MTWILIITAFILNSDGTQNYVGIKGQFLSQDACITEMNRLKPLFDVSPSVSASCTNSAELNQVVTSNIIINGSLIIQ